MNPEIRLNGFEPLTDDILFVTYENPYTGEIEPRIMANPMPDYKPVTGPLVEGCAPIWAEMARRVREQLNKLAFEDICPDFGEEGEEFVLNLNYEYEMLSLLKSKSESHGVTFKQSLIELLRSLLEDEELWMHKA